MTAAKKATDGATAREVDTKPDAVDAGEKLEVTLPIQDANRDQLEIFAMKYLGLDVEMADDADKIRAKMMEVGYVLPFITIQKVVGKARGPVQLGDEGFRINRRPHPTIEGEYQVRIMIPAASGPGGKQPVSCGCNGIAILLPRNVPMWVAERYIEILNNAVEIQYPEYDVERNILGGLDSPNMVPSYPFTFV